MSIGLSAIGVMPIGMKIDAEDEEEPQPTSQTALYFNLAGYDLTGKIIVPIKAGGYTKSTNSWSIPTRIYSKIRENGVKSLEWSFSVVFPNHTEGDAFRRKCNNLVENVKFFSGSRDWYHVVKYMSVGPDQIDEDIYHVLLELKLLLEDPLLRSDAAQTYYATSASLPAVSRSFNTSEATADSPFDNIRIVGKYNNGSHLKDLSVTLLNGSNEISTAFLSDKLLSNEKIVLSGNQIITEYVESFVSSDRMTLDTQGSSNVVVNNRKATISQNGYLTYKLSGPNSTLDNILLQAIINVVSGSPYIRTSIDNQNWETGVLASELAEASGIYTDFYLSETDKRGDVYVQFYCPVGASMEIEFMRLRAIREIYMKRDFVIPADKTDYYVEVQDGDDSSHLADIYIEFCQRRYP